MGRFNEEHREEYGVEPICGWEGARTPDPQAGSRCGVTGPGAPYRQNRRVQRRINFPPSAVTDDDPVRRRDLWTFPVHVHQNVGNVGFLQPPEQGESFGEVV